MNHIADLDVDAGELARRRKLFFARRERESDREALLDHFTRATARAEALRNWIQAYAGPERSDLYPEIRRMIDWAKAELKDVEAGLEAGRLNDGLRDRNLFPEIDDLADPLGEPPARLGWGR
jgi:hypothetical protein